MSEQLKPVKNSDTTPEVNPTQFVIEGLAQKQRIVNGQNGQVHLTILKTPNPDEFNSGSRFVVKSNVPIANQMGERVKVLVKFSNFVRDEAGRRQDGSTWEVTQNQTTFELVSKL